MNFDHLGVVTIGEWFHNVARLLSDKTAIEYKNCSITYHDLDLWSTDIAQQIVENDVIKSGLVGVSIRRSPQMVATILGIIKAGCGYLPLDPSLPATRLQYIRQNSGVEVIFIDNHATQDILALDVVKIPVPDFMVSSTRQTRLPNIKNTIGYVTYTSGSTGNPKGVVMRQAALLNMLQWQVNEFERTFGVRTIQYTSLNFDVSFQEIFSTLLSGGVLVLVDDELRRDPYLLSQELISRQIERLYLPFIALQTLSEDLLENASESALREVITAGEQLRITHSIRRLFSSIPAARLINHYGPSETHVVTAYTLPHQVDTWPNLPPIGKPIQNVRLYVLDDQQRPVDFGTPGELYVAGSALAEGYLNNSELTNEKFLQLENLSNATECVYKTGDIVTWRADGILEYLGRADDQVKVRGHRIELAEIEAKLDTYEGISEAAAVVKTDGKSGDKEIHLFLVVKNRLLDLDEVKMYLSTQLPEYMLPRSINKITALPLTLTGKVDRLTLAAQITARTESRTIGPTSSSREAIRSIWEDTLGLLKITDDDNYFHLGGNSIIAAKIASRIRKELGTHVTMRTVFEHPTVGSLTEFIEHMFVSTGTHCQIESRGDAPRSLSDIQKGLWFIQEMLPNSPLYNISFGLNINGQLEREKIVCALEHILSQHTALRTKIVQVDGSPQVSLFETSEILKSSLEFYKSDKDLRNDDWLEHVKSDFSRRPFKFGNDALIRALIIEYGESTIILFSVHHLIFDGHSVGIFVKELQYIFNLLIKGDPKVLPQPTKTFFDYVELRRSAQTKEEDVNYWAAVLNDVPPLLALPLDHPRKKQNRYQGKTVHFNIEAILYKKLKDFCRVNKTTPFTILLSAYVILLHRFSRQNDFVVAAASGERPAEMEDLIGLFVNNLLYRIRFDQNPEISTVIQSITEQTLAGLPHILYPINGLLGKLGIGRDTQINSLYQVMFAMEHPALDRVQLGEFEAEFFETHTNTAKFDLLLSMTDSSHNLKGYFEYNSDLFDQTTIASLSVIFVNILEAICHDPTAPVKHVPLDPKGTLSRSLATGIQRPVDNLPGIFEQFKAHATRSPDRTAIIDESGVTSYGQLLALAQMIASHLKKMGMSRNSRIALLLPPTHQYVACILGVLSQQCTYVPVNLDQPTERIRSMLTDAEVALVICHDPLYETLRKDLPGVPVHNIGELLSKTVDAVACSQQTDEAAHAASDFMAYIIFTSGSTGHPKGAGIYAESEKNLLRWYSELLALDVNSTMTIISSFSFDMTQKSILAPLLHGGRLCLPNMAHYNPEYISEIIEKNATNFISCTPSAFYPIYDIIQSDPKKHASLSKIALGGEPINVDYLYNWLSQDSGVPTIINTYGPTECTDIVSYFVLNNSKWIAENRSPIGYPIDNVTLLVLDEGLNLVPQGIVGEIYLSGLCIGAGYVNDPIKTAEVFIDHPQFIGRLYRTGDLGRFLNDGSLEYLGRLDKQVKLRGFRIEPGEIESVLLRHPKVREAAVEKCYFSDGTDALVAFTAIDNEGQPSSVELRNFVSDYLPTYMAPSIFRFLDALPKTVSGKINRKLLIEQFNQAEHSKDAIQSEVKGTTNKQDGVLPEVENRIREVWAELLHLPPQSINIQDNFFDLGGNSLAAIRLRQRLHEIGIPLTLYQIFSRQSVAAQALCYQERRLESHDRATDMMPALAPLTPQQEMALARIGDHPQFDRWAQTLYLKLDTAADPDEVKAAVFEVYHKHHALQTRFKYSHGKLMQGQDEDPEGKFNKIVSSHVAASSSEATNLQNIASQLLSELNFKNNSLIRIAIVTYCDSPKLTLVIAVHHMIFDGQSVSIFTEDLECALNKRILSDTSGLDQVSASYGKYVKELWSYLESEDMKQEGDRLEEFTHALVDSVITIKDEHVEHDGPKLFARTIKGEQFTQLMNLQAVRTFGIEVFLLSRCVWAFSKTWEQPLRSVYRIINGRYPVIPNLDLTKTMGWLSRRNYVLVGRQNGENDDVYLSRLRNNIHQSLSTGLADNLLYRSKLHLTPNTVHITRSAKALEFIDERTPVAFNFTTLTGQYTTNGIIHLMPLPPVPEAFRPSSSRLHIFGELGEDQLILTCGFDPEFWDEAAVQLFLSNLT